MKNALGGGLFNAELCVGEAASVVLGLGEAL